MKRVLEPEWKACLKERGIGVPPGRFVPYAQAPAFRGQDLRGVAAPYVLKAVSPRIVHKTEVGAVRVGIPTTAALLAELRAMAERLDRQGLAPPDGFLVEEMVAPGLELLLAVERSPEWGRLLAFGTGGVAVEAVGRVEFRALPLRRGDVPAMIAAQGWLPAALARLGAERLSEVEALLWSVGGAGGLATDDRLPAWEINPLVVNAAGVFAVDVRDSSADGGEA